RMKIFDEVEKVLSVRCLDDSRFVRCGELFDSKCSNRLEHCKSRSRTKFCLVEQALIDQLGQGWHGVTSGTINPLAKPLDRWGSASTRKNRQAPEQPLFGWAQQIVGPRDRVAHGALPIGKIPRTIAQPIEPIWYLGQQHFRRARSATGRCQLD